MIAICLAVIAASLVLMAGAVVFREAKSLGNDISVIKTALTVLREEVDGIHEGDQSEAIAEIQAEVAGLGEDIEQIFDDGGWRRRREL